MRTYHEVQGAIAVELLGLARRLQEHEGLRQASFKMHALGLGGHDEDRHVQDLEDVLTHLRRATGRLRRPGDAV